MQQSHSVTRLTASGQPLMAASGQISMIANTRGYDGVNRTSRLTSQAGPVLCGSCCLLLGISSRHLTY